MVPWASKETIIWRLQVQSSLQASNNTGILNTCTRLWLTESEQATPRGFNRGCSSKFREGSRVRQTPEEGQRIYRPKHCGNNNKDENNCPKNLNDKNQEMMLPFLKKIPFYDIFNSKYIFSCINCFFLKSKIFAMKMSFQLAYLTYFLLLFFSYLFYLK